MRLDLRKFPVFSRLTGKIPTETGSPMTASTARSFDFYLISAISLRVTHKLTHNEFNPASVDPELTPSSSPECARFANNASDARNRPAHVGIGDQPDLPAREP